MTDRLMADRLEALRRIGKVQAEMTRLAEWRLHRAETQAGELALRAERLRGFAAGGPDAALGGAAGGTAGGTLDATLGAGLARAALRSLGEVSRAQAAAERDRDAQRAALDALRRRDGALDAALARAAGAARRASEARDLAATLDAWLAAPRQADDA